MGATCLLMAFSRIKIKPNRVINWVAASAFAVYLLHAGREMGYYKLLVRTIYNSYSGVECLALIFLALCGVFLVAVFLDQPRKLIWKYLSKLFPVTTK